MALRHCAPDAFKRNPFGHGGWSGTQFWTDQDSISASLPDNASSPYLESVALDQLIYAVVSGSDQQLSDTLLAETQELIFAASIQTSLC